MRYKEVFSQLDTDRFGFKIGRADGAVFKDNPKQIFEDLKSQSYKLLISRVNMDDIDLINAMEDLGFRIKDSQITYRYELNQKNPLNTASRVSSYEVRNFIESDTDVLVELSKACFDNYGHYFANPRLDKEKCREVYGDWTYNSCMDPQVADKIFVSCDNGIPIGYLSFKIYEKNNNRYAAGGTGAVDVSYRGKNIFPSLILAGLEWGRDIGLDWEEHNTLVNNLAVNRSMIKMGFKFNNHVVTMHCWLDE